MLILLWHIVFPYREYLGTHFPISQAWISRSFRIAIRNFGVTVSLVTTLEWVVDDVGAPLWTSATSPALRIKLPSIFVSKIMCVPQYLNPGFIFHSLVWSGFTPSKTSKVTRALGIKFSTRFVQTLVPVFWPMLYTSWTVFGTWIPKLFLALQYFDLTFKIIWSCLQGTSFTHHLIQVHTLCYLLFRIHKVQQGLRLWDPSMVPILRIHSSVWFLISNLWLSS